MTLAGMIFQVQAHFPGAPQQWDSTDGSMPFRLLMAYFAGLSAKLALERINSANAHVLSQGGPQAKELAATTANEVFG